jgi:uncharacterized protein HemX
MSFSDSEKADLEASAHHSARVRWDPNVSLGSVVSLCVMLGAGYAFVSDLQRANDKQDLYIAALQEQAVQERADARQALRDLQAQVRSLELLVRELQTELKRRP